jgi:hypothetical protein
VLPQLSRFAVMQHLTVLECAGVVIVRRNGRERWNELNAVPIQRELERWLNSFQRATAAQLLAFERQGRRRTRGRARAPRRSPSSRRSQGR